MSEGRLRTGMGWCVFMGLAGMLGAFAGVAALGQGVSTTTVQGTMYLANGQPASGTLMVSWPAFTTAGGQLVAADRTSVTIPADGYVSVNLAPNQGSTPAGEYYTAIFYLSDGTVTTQYWVVPTGAQATLAQVQAQIMPAAEAVQTVSKAYVDQAVTEATGDQLAVAGGTLTGALYLNGDPSQPTQAADKHYVDESFAQAVPITGGAVSGELTAKQLGAAYEVDQFTGADFGAKLEACLAALNATYGGTCDARNFTGTLAMGANVTVSTGNTTIDLPCATIATANQIVVTAGTRNVALKGCALRGGTAANGNLGGTVLEYTGAAAMVQVGDPTYAADTMGFHMDNLDINTTEATSAAAEGFVAYRTQELDLESLYFLGNSNQTAMTLDGTGNYTGGTFLDNAFNGFGTAVNAVGHEVANPATTDWMNASMFVRLHIDCPTSSGSPIAGTVGINLAQGDGNTFTGGDVEGCSTALHLGPNAQNNTIVGLRNENSTNQVVADAGSSYNNWMTGGTMFTGALTDNGTRNSFLDTFHRAFNGMKGDWYGSQQDATVTNHYRLGIGTGNERGLLNEIQTDYGYRWIDGYSDGTTGEQFYQVQDLLNNVNRLSIGQYLTTGAGVVSNLILNNGGCYSSSAPPSVTISGGGGSGAAGTPVMAASSCSGGYTVASVTIANAGSGYTSQPTLSWSGSNQVTAPNAIAEISTAGSTDNQTVLNAAGTGAVVLNGSNNSGTGGVVVGSGGPSETTVATIDHAGNAQFNGTLQVSGASTFTSTPTVKNQADAEIDAALWAGLTTAQKESYIYKDWNGTSQWYMVKDASNNWALNSAVGGLDSFKAYQSTNSGDTYIDASNAAGAVRINYETGSGTAFNIYGGGSGSLYASFSGASAIKFPGLASPSGYGCLQIDNSGWITNAGVPCGGGTGGGGTVGSGNAGQIAYYSASGTTVSGVSTIPVGSGGTGATTQAAAFSNIVGPGGAVTGSLITELPRVNIESPQFGTPAGCANAADPTDKLDSSCAINAAVAYLLTQCNASSGYQCPSLYIPEGIFNISAGAVSVPSNVRIMGDGGKSSILRLSNATSNLLTITQAASVPDTFAAGIRDVGLEGNDHSTAGTLLEIGPTNGEYTVQNVRMWNHGGRGIWLFEVAEKTKFFNVMISDVRWPITAIADGIKFMGITIIQPGQTASGYCYNINCINGVAPGAGGQTVVSAVGDGTTQTYVMDGTSPVAVGNFVELSGITGTTALNGYYQVATVANNSPSSGEFTLTAAGTANGTATVTSATFLTAIVPENRHAAIWNFGAQDTFEDGDIKPLGFVPAIKDVGATDTTMSHIYFEGSLQGEDWLGSANSSVLLGGLPDEVDGNGTVGQKTVGANTYYYIPYVDASWWPYYVENPLSMAADNLETGWYRGNVYVFCQDYNANSTSPCAQNPGVQQNEFEIAQVVAAGDGNLYFVTRNMSGSTVPSNTAWVNPHFELAASSSSNDGVVLSDNFTAANNPNYKAGFTGYCLDASAYQCQEIEIGGMGDGYIGYQWSWGAGSSGTNVEHVAKVTVTDLAIGTGYGVTELQGADAIKSSAIGDVFLKGTYPASKSGETSETLNNGALSANLLYGLPAAVYATGGFLTIASPDYRFQNAADNGAPPYFIMNLAGPNMTGIGTNPGSSTWAMGRQFYQSNCDYDVGTSQGHAQTRWCEIGYSGTSNAQSWVFGKWNGTSWVPQVTLGSNSSTFVSPMTVQGTINAEAGLQQWGTDSPSCSGGTVALSGNYTNYYMTVSNACAITMPSSPVVTNMDLTIYVGTGASFTWSGITGPTPSFAIINSEIVTLHFHYANTTWYYENSGSLAGTRQWACQPGLGDGYDAIPAQTYPLSECWNTTGSTVTITSIKCFSDNSGSTTMNASGATLGPLLTGPITCSSSAPSGTQSANVLLTNGDHINFSVVADGTTKQVTTIVAGTY
ncbi:MAG: beta strand repeat-containing protein [Terracidiphilus sp.]